MNNLSDIFDCHKKSIVEFIDGVRNEAYQKGRADERAKTLEEVLERSIIIHGEELYGSQTKLLLFTEEVFNQVFKGGNIK